jgi:glycosyltransferase involved in cell wall biosynthesis
MKWLWPTWGNNPHHRWVLPYLAHDPAIVVVHDLVLHHLLVEARASEGAEERLEMDLEKAHGMAGRALARARRVGYRGALDPFLFPARRALLSGVAGVVTHSEWGCREIRRDLPGIPVHRVPLTVADPMPVDREQLRRRLGAAARDIVLMHMGFLTAEKGLFPVLEAVAVVRRAGVPIRLAVVGEGRARGELERAAAALGIGDAMIWTGWVDEREIASLPAAADLGVVLRNPSAGETSAAVLRFLAAGTPVAVTARRQFLELPTGAAHRITPGPAATAELVEVFRGLGSVAGGDRRRVARATYEREHRPADVAERWLEILNEEFSESGGP